MRIKLKAIALLTVLSMTACLAASCNTKENSSSAASSGNAAQSSSASSDVSSEEVSSSDMSSEQDTASQPNQTLHKPPVSSSGTGSYDEPDDEPDDEEPPRELTAIEKPSNEFTDTKLGKYKYVWGDEFNSNQLDLSKWTIKAHSPASLDTFMPEWGNENLSKVFHMKDGLATQNFRRWYDPTNTLIQYAQTAHLMTRPTMSWQYGYLEVRLRMSFRPGEANAIWMSSGNALNNKNDYCGLEVDVFETLGSTDSVTPNIHFWYKDGRHTDYNGTYLKGEAKSYSFFDTTNLANEFHLYGFEWTPTEMAMYVDGEKYWTLDTTKSFDSDPDTTVFNQPIYLMLHGGGFTKLSAWDPALPLINNTDLPLDYSVDWVRLYQNPSMKGTQLNVAK